MVKVISLKLTKKEERIVNFLNKEGITNSDLLRSALWHYFDTVDKTERPTDRKMVNLTVNDEIKLKQKEPETILIFDYVNHLKNEIDLLREQNSTVQRQVSKNILTMKDPEHSIKIKNDTKEQLPIINDIKSSSNIHFEIDDFLKRKEKL